MASGNIITSFDQFDFEALKSFDKIIVSGPQRSGTNLACQYLDSVLGYNYIDELEFNFFLETHFLEKIREHKKLIMQAPTMSHVLHLIEEPKTCVFFLFRNPSEIIRSQNRVRWAAERHERKNYTRKEYEFLPISIAKYSEWCFHQRKLMKVPFFELDFEALRSSPIWSSDFGSSSDYQPDTSWKPDSAKDDGGRWAFVDTGKGKNRSLKVVEYWFETDEAIEKCRIPRK